MYTKQLKIFGCGGHSKVVVDALLLMAQSLQVSFCDDNEALLGTEINGIPVDSTSDSLAGFTGFIHLAIGNNNTRHVIINTLPATAALYTIIHPASIISTRAVIDPGCFIAAGAILAPESHVGRSCIINHGAVIDHEVTVGECSHIAPNATLGGSVTVGKRVLIGAGAVILPGVTIGDGAIIGAGAVVLETIRENTTVTGVPARSKE